ncbi:MAG: YdcF family protein [Candidatus Riflebacteria bacterium]|nr:YdcF family protein [Candidatus Riflebacteria bacterium]
MKRLSLILLPFFFFIALGQINLPQQQFFAALFVTLSAIFYAVSHKQSDPFHKNHFDDFRNGLLLLAIFVIILSAFPLGGYLAEPLMMKHSEENADAIVVLASGAMLNGMPGYSGYQRVSHGVNLLQQGRAPRLVISTGFSKINGHAEAEWVASFTAMMSIDPASLSILISKDIITTATEAEYIHKVLSEAGINSILLVTSNAHIYRSVLTFAKKGFEVLPAPVHTPDGVYSASEHNITGLNAAIHEWIGLVYYSLRGRI